jgi:hypothetical protein
MLSFSPRRLFRCRKKPAKIHLLTPAIGLVSGKKKKKSVGNAPACAARAAGRKKQLFVLANPVAAYTQRCQQNAARGASRPAIERGNGTKKNEPGNPNF